MESAKSTLSLTEYFVSLPSSRNLAGGILILCIIVGALFAPAKDGNFNFFAMLGGAGTGIVVVALPAFISAGALAMLRRRVVLRRALALALISSLIYIIFDLAALYLSNIFPWGANITFIGIGLAFIAWFAVLRFAFGLEKSAWFFSALQLCLHAAFMLAGFSLALGTHPAGIAAKIGVTAFVFLSAMGGLLFLASAPLKKGLGLTSSDALSMFLSQWLYGEKDLEEAFDEIGEEAHTLAGCAGIRTTHGECILLTPYIHFGPFGNLGGSQFSHQLASALRDGEKTSVFVFHGTATHDFDPVSTSQISSVVAACKKAMSSFSYAPASWSYSQGKAGDSICHLVGINDDALVSFTRSPLSTEDVNFAIGWALMQQAEKKYSCAIVSDCHNAETGDIDYVEPGSPIAFEMSDALSNAMKKDAAQLPMLAGWAESQGAQIRAVGSGGLKFLLLSSNGAKGRRPSLAYLVIDGNGITGFARDRLISALEKWGKEKGMQLQAEIFTTDTHQMNNVRGVFNPAGASGGDDLDALESEMLLLAGKAHSRLAKASFACGKERFALKVLGPYQSAEIVTTLNSVVAILKIAMPIVLVVSIAFLLWALSQI